ncbi:bifunctional riboflavin kinase/FAD synthetase [Pleurocapsales cyanobacterium LEGE 10410]|nr:bifunctional riboflavin kinase/FAD synthetase [Pleurocapsales cyanobacterium LEGE 10410]
MLVASSIEQIRTPTAIALGNFDGIHQGHRVVLQPVINSCQTSQQPHVYPSVVSFSPHPREFFTGGKVQLLTPIDQKAELLADLGIEQLILLPFNRDLASLNPQQFVEQILVKQLQADLISVGSDFRFGYQRQGTGEDLKNIAASFGIKVHLNSLHEYHDSNNQAVRVSSSLIRQALHNGEIKLANAMLGRPYSLIGTVVTGQQLGRTIGFPTANLQLPPEKFLPRYGVYSVDVLLEETVFKGVMNIGCRPTVAGDAPTIEVHLLNWSGDLYGQTLKVNLIEFLRPEQKFASVEALKQQITKDCQAVLNY